MYRKVLKDVIKDLERTNDLIEVSNYLKSCDKNEFLNIINELLNQLSEEKIENNRMKKKILNRKEDRYNSYKHNRYNGIT